MDNVTLNVWLLAFLVVFLLQDVFAVWMNKLNRSHMAHWGNRVPKPFEGYIDEEKLQQITAYTLEYSRVSLTGRLVSDLALLLVILSGFLPYLAHVLTEWNTPYIVAGLLFFMAPGLLLSLVEFPFEYYVTFVVEEKYGFNRSTLKLWIMDQIKSGLISIILSAILLAVVLWIVRISPHRWWLWAFIFISAVQLLLVELYPVLIAPLFNKFTPIEDRELAEKIRALMNAGGFKVKTILQMDAGTRSRHTNAFFTGIGKAKRIVLFDTLIQSHPHDEVLGVLAHEIGHFKKKHVLKQIILLEFSMLIVFYLTYRLMEWPQLYSTFGFESAAPYVGLFFAGLVWKKLGFFLRPLYMAISRRYERQADAFSVGLLKTAEPMVRSLKRLASDNLANLTPHPLYVWFNYSHPPLAERIAILEEAALAEGVMDGGAEGGEKA